MKLKIGHLFGAMQVLHAIIDEKRPMPQLGKFRLARMHAKLLPEFIAANAQRDVLIQKYGEPIGGNVFGFAVHAARIGEFNAEWQPIEDAEVEIEVDPIRVSDLTGKDDPANGPIEASELLLLGELVTE